MSSPEKRQSPRFSINELIKIQLKTESLITAHGINISSRGIYCELDHKVDVPSKVSMALLLDEGTDQESSIHCEGEVIRLNTQAGHHFAAIRFNSLQPHDRSVLDQFLDSLK